MLVYFTNRVLNVLKEQSNNKLVKNTYLTFSSTLSFTIAGSSGRVTKSQKKFNL